MALYRRDRPTDNHGGVCFYIKEDIYSRRRTDLELAHVECVWVEINIHHKKILFIAALWSPAGKGLTSWLSFVVLNCVFVTFPCGILGRVWYLIVSIPDLCPLFLTLEHFFLGGGGGGGGVWGGLQNFEI